MEPTFTRRLSGVNRQSQTVGVTRLRESNGLLEARPYAELRRRVRLWERRRGNREVAESAQGFPAVGDVEDQQVRARYRRDHVVLVRAQDADGVVARQVVAERLLEDQLAGRDAPTHEHVVVALGAQRFEDRVGHAVEPHVGIATRQYN